MIYITGDTHGEFGRFSNRRLKKQGQEFEENDYVIVCGDFGLCWAKDRTFEYNCRNFSEKKYTILWVQGNHENYDMIAEYPVEKWHGGNVRHIIRDKVILLERGQIFDIEGKTFFTFGGASSHDVQGGIFDRNDANFEHKRKNAARSGKPYRVIHESWWEEELPNEDEMNEGLLNLKLRGNKVDYVLTHCCSTSLQEMIENITGKSFGADVLTDYLQTVEGLLEYKHWYFGHYHMDKCVDEKHSVLYHGIIPLEGQGVLDKIPVLGKPAYTYGDIVKIKWDDSAITGKIVTVDANGTFDQKEEPSYDILSEEQNCLYKHVCESQIIGKV